MKWFEKCDALVKARVNGNSIRENKTYQNMFGDVTKKELIEFGQQFNYVYLGGNKYDIIDGIANKIIKRG